MSNISFILLMSNISFIQCQIILDADMFARIIAARPHVVCLCLGGNYLATATPVMVALDMIRLARRLLSSGVQCVCVGQVCHRLRWRNVTHSVGDSLVQELNA